MSERFMLDLLENGKAELPIDYRFVVQMTIILYYDEDFLRKIKDAQTKYKMEELREKVDKIIEKKEIGTFTERIAKTIQKRIQTIRNRKQKTKGGKKNKSKKIRKN